MKADGIIWTTSSHERGRSGFDGDTMLDVEENLQKLIGERKKLALQNDCLNSAIAIFTRTKSRIISTNKGEGDIMKKGILSILVAVAVFLVIVVIQTLVKNMAFTEALSKPYNFFLAAIAFVGTYTAMSRKGKQ